MKVVGIDMTYTSGQEPGTPVTSLRPGMRKGLWWVWHSGETRADGTKAPDELDASNARGTMHAHALRVMTKAQPPAHHRVPVLDLEGHADKEAKILRCIPYFRECLDTPMAIIGQWWPGMPNWNLPVVVATLEGKSSKKRTEMFALARKHKEIIKVAGMATQLGMIHRPDGGTGPNSQYGTKHYIRSMEVLADFMREAYDGTPIALWTSGAYIGMPDYPELTPADADALVDVAMRKYDYVYIYGEHIHNDVYGTKLSARLLAQT